MPSPQIRRPVPHPSRTRAPASQRPAAVRGRRAGGPLEVIRGSRRWRMAATAAAGTTAAALFVLLTARVKGRWTTPLDRAVRRPLRRGLRGLERDRRQAAALGISAVGKLGDTLAYVPGAALGAYLLHRRGAAGGGALFGSAASVALGRHVFRWVFPRFRPPTHLAQWNAFASYPSGHATGTLGVGLTAAHVFAHEGLVRPLPALGAVLALSAAVGAARVAKDQHWATDIVGGWLAGIVVASVATLAYEGRKAVDERGGG
jgi:membrane-associated phospholipid phosphatase